jgi:Zn-dependent peptidase ImmA (M78 family)/predicted secreted protein
MSRRETVLEATAAASRLHQQLNSEEMANDIGGGIDVFGAIARAEVLLFFRPLDGLLGAFMSQPSPGIVVTTNRGLAVQRFTAAHELGHFELEHEVSLDADEILVRHPFGSIRYDDRELGADVFAAEFLMPLWLLESHAVRQGWTAESFNEPAVIYQLALRIGTSYEATCRTLARHQVIDQTTLRKHLSVAPKRIKQELVGKDRMQNWNPDVWVITEHDRGTLIQGGPNDFFLIRLRENSGAGYLWNVEQLEHSGFVIVSDERRLAAKVDQIGGPVERVLIAASQAPVEGQLELEHARPWDRSAIADHFTLTYQMFGKESGTLPRVEKMRKLAAAA